MQLTNICVLGHSFYVEWNILLLIISPGKLRICLYSICAYTVFMLMQHLCLYNIRAYIMINIHFETTTAKFNKYKLQVIRLTLKLKLEMK